MANARPIALLNATAIAPRLGDAGRHGGASHPQAAHGQLLPELSRAAAARREGHRVGRAGGLRPRRLDPLGRRSRARPGHGRHLEKPGQPAVRGDRREGRTLPRPPHRRRLALRLARRHLPEVVAAAASSRSQWRSPSASTATAGARCSASTSAPRKPDVPGRIPTQTGAASLRGVKLVISDAHEGLKAAIAKVLGAGWQRCRVHFMRNALAHANKNGRRVVSAFIATAFAQTTADAAGKQWRHVADQLRAKLPKLAVLLYDAESTSSPS